MYPGVQPMPRTTRRRKKSLNPLKILCSLAFLGLFAYYIMPHVFANYFEPMFLNRYLNRNIKPDASLYISPTLNYLSNASLLSQNILIPNAKMSSGSSGKLNKIISSGRNAYVEARLSELASNYPQLSPSIYIWDYSTGQSVEINADEPIPTASIIKIPILFELFRQIEDKQYGSRIELGSTIKFEELYRTSGSGDLQYRQEGGKYSVNYLANLMITRSDNSATNMLLDTIGGKVAMNRAFRTWGLKQSRIANWLPDLDGENKMSPKDVATILYNLDNPSFLTSRSKEQIKDYMYNVENTNLLYAGLPKGAVLLHKTGDIGTMLGDAGIAYRADGKKYIIAVMVQRPFNDSSARSFIREVSSIVYNSL